MEPAIKRLLKYSVGDTFVVRGNGYTAGWLMGQRVERELKTNDETTSVGNVKEADLEMLPHSAEVQILRSHFPIKTFCMNERWR